MTSRRDFIAALAKGTVIPQAPMAGMRAFACNGVLYEEWAGQPGGLSENLRERRKV